MAQKTPGFVTGANAKIKLGDATMAYCTDVAYNIVVQTIPIEAMGKYERFANEPVGYEVDGSFSIIRYTNRAADTNQAVAEQGNAPDQIGTTDSHSMMEHLNPATLLTSQTFDIEIHEKVKAPTADDATTAGINEAVSGVGKIFKISDCRLTRRGATLNKRGILVDAYAFVGILAGDNEGDNYQVGSSSVTDSDLDQA